MTEYLPFLLLIVALIGSSAFFSGTEVAMFALRRADKERMAKSENLRDTLVLRLIENPRRLLATLLIGNESTNVAISAVMAGGIERFVSTGSEVKNALLATAVALPILLLVGEIAPKTIAMGSPLPWARRSSRPLWLFGGFVAPLRFVVRGVADFVLRVLLRAPKESGQDDISEEEFRVLVDAGSAEGEVDDRERKVIHRVFEFGDKTVSDVMRVRRKVFALAYELPRVRLMQEISERGYSRVPIYSKSIDNIQGILYAKDLVIASCVSGPPAKLSTMLHPAFFIPQTTKVASLLAVFKEGKTHMAMVVNEYGRLVGIVTLEDLLEELFGDIRDEREAQQAKAGSYRAPSYPELPIVKRQEDS